MLKTAERVIRKSVMTSDNYRLWRENDRIRACQPAKARARVIVLAMGKDGLRSRGKVTPKLFFPTFCRIIAHCGVGSVYVKDRQGLEQALQSSDEAPTVLIDILNEDFDDQVEDNIPQELLQGVRAVFNSRRIARIIRDKKVTNTFLSERSVPMPRLGGLQNGRVFSNARWGSKEEVSVHDGTEDLDGDRYNSEFVDTQVQFEENVYHTSIRLMCIGSRLVQVYVRARDQNESNPSVHNANTPRDKRLLDHLYGNLVCPRLDELDSLAEKIGSVLGPGFYAHDVLVESKSKELFVCETGFKFYDGSYCERMNGVLGDRGFIGSVFDQETYAGYAAAVFLSYCGREGYL